MMVREALPDVLGLCVQRRGEDPLAVFADRGGRGSQSPAFGEEPGGGRRGSAISPRRDPGGRKI